MGKFSTIISVIQRDVFRGQLSWTVFFFPNQPKANNFLVGAKSYLVLWPFCQKNQKTSPK